MSDVRVDEVRLPPAFADGAAVPVARDVILATGPDSESYLQGQLSQDVSALAPGQSAWSLLLQPQGKIDAWLRVTRLAGDSYLLDLDAGAGEAALGRLTRFKLRTRCELELHRWSTVSLRAPAGTGALDGLPAADGVIMAPAEWPAVDGVDLLGPDVAIPEGMTVASPEDLERLRMLCGVPAMGAELTERTIPAETGIVERSVSFTKGCYTGQELVARIDSRGGHVPRRLCGLVGAAPLEVGAPVRVGDDDVGQVTSAIGELGLAYVKRAVEHLPAAATVGGVDAEIRALPMI